ncbi:DUF637 domain-containing protein, partial [Spartinivicinus poritis]
TTGNTVITTAGVLDNQQGEIATNNAGLTITAQTVNNQQGKITHTGQQSLTITAQQINNQQGELFSKGHYQNGQTNLDNRSGVVAANQVTITGNSHVDNSQGEIVAEQLTIQTTNELINDAGLISQLGDNTQILSAKTIRNGIVNGQQGRIESNATHLTLQAESLENSGDITHVGTGTLDVAIQWLNNLKGKLQSNQSLNVSADSIDNSQGIIGANNVELTTQQALNNQSGLIQAKNNTTLTVGSDLLNQQGQIQTLAGNGQTLVNVQGQLDNTHGIIRSENQQLTVNVNTLNNQSGNLVQASNKQLTVTTNQLNNQQGKIISLGSYQQQGGAIDNQQGFISAKSAAITSASQLDNTQGQIEAEALTVNLQGDLINDGGALRQVGTADQQITARHISNKTVAGKAGQLASNAAQLTITAQSLENEGEINHAGVQLLTLAIDSLENIKGKINANNALNIHTTQLNNTQGVIAGKTAEITTTDQLNNTQGLIESGTQLAINAGLLLLNVSGTLRAIGQAGDTTLQANQINNRQGTIESNNQTLQITAAGLDNTQGLIKHSGDQTTINATNNVMNNKGQILAEGLLSVTGQQLNNIDGTLYSTGGLDVDVNGINNTRGLIYNHHNSDLSFNFVNGQLINEQGKVLSDLDLAINALSINNSQGLLQAGRQLSINTNDLFSLNGSDIRGGQGISVDTNNLINDGTLATQGDLSLAVNNSLTNKGTISALGSLSLRAKTLTNEVNSALTANAIDTLTVQGTLTNKGRLTGFESFSLNANALVNSGTLGSGDALTLNITQKLTNNNGEEGSLIFSAGDMKLFANEIENRFADIYSNGDLVIARNNGLAKNKSIINSSGLIESLGNIDIYTNSLLNKKDRFEYKEFPTSGTITYQCLDCKGSHYDLYYFVEERQRADIVNDSPASQLVAGGNLTIKGGDIVNQNSLISANKNITITGAKLVNQGAQVTTGTRYRKFRNPEDSEGKGNFYNLIENDIRIYNESNSAEIIKYTDTKRYYSHDGGERIQEIFFSPSEQKTGVANPNYDPDNYVPVPTQILGYTLVEDSTVRTESEPVGKSTIQAGGNINVQVSQTISNSELKPNGALKQISNKVGNVSAVGRQLAHQAPQAINQARKSVDEATVALQLGSVANTLTNSQSQVNTGNGTITANTNAANRVPAGSAFIAVNPLQVSGFRLPKGKYGLFTLPTATPKHNYLIETNPAYADYATYLSSGYLLNRLGYNEDKITKRLGDGLYETHLIRQAIFAQTGRRFITSYFASDYDQFKYLMDNAVASKEQLNLSLGVSLTPEQVAALTHDIVWLEEQQVDGHNVLVPVVYLAQSRPGELAADGSLIIGQNINLLSGGDLNNAGTIHAYKDLKISAANNILNTGIIAANNDLTAVAGDNIINSQAGQIIANTLSLTAIDGSVINDRLVAERRGTWTRGHEFIVSDVDQASVIHANQELKITAGQDILNQASVISSLGNARLVAGNNIENTAKQQNKRDAYLFHKGHEIKESIRQVGSKIDVKGNLALQAGNDITVVASQVNAGGQVNLTAGNDVTVVAAANEDHYDYYYKGGSKKLTIKQDSVHHQKALISSGENTTVKAGGNIQLLGSDIDAKGNVDLTAQGELNALAATDQEYYYYEKKKKGSFGRKKFQLDNTLDQVVVASTIKAGNDLTVTTGGDQEYQAAELTAGNTLALTSGGKLKFTAAKTQQVERHEKSKSSLVWQKAKGAGSTDETLHYTKILAKHPIILKAAEGIEVDVEHVDNATIDQMRERIVQADPSLAWLNTLAERGDVDYNTIRTIHESWDYEHSGLSGAGALIVVIVVAALTNGTGAGLVKATAGTWQAAAANAAFTTATQQFAIGTINNKGNIGAGLKNTFSKDSLKNIASSGLSAGLLTGYVNPALGVDVTAKLNLKNISDIKQFVIQQTAEATTKAFVNSAIYGGDLGDNVSHGLVNAASNIASGLAFNAVGDLAEEYPGLLPNGSPQKATLHAIVGGLLSEASGGDFKSGAIAAGANEILIEQLTKSKWFNEGKREVKVEALSQLIGVTAASLVDGDPEQGAQIALQATRYNLFFHEQLLDAAEEIKKCGNNDCIADLLKKRLAQSDEQTLQAIQVCGGGSQADCADIIRNVANSNGNSKWIDEYYAAILSEGTPEQIRAFNRLRQENKDFDQLVQPSIIQKTVEVLIEPLANKLGLTPKQTQALIVSASGTLLISKLRSSENSRRQRVDNDSNNRINSNNNQEVETANSNSHTTSRQQTTQPEIRTFTAGSTGNWSRELSNPRPNTVYRIDGNSFQTDSLGRTIVVDIQELRLNRTDRNRHQQRVAGRNFREDDDVGGHLLGAQFGGPGEGINIVAMNRQLNGNSHALGRFGQLETEWANRIRSGERLGVTIRPIYEGNSLRPVRFDITETVNGQVQSRIRLLNQPGG